MIIPYQTGAGLRAQSNGLLASVRVTSDQPIVVGSNLFSGPPQAAAAQSVEKGKAAYVKHGCWQCHGFAAQGGVAGPKLAPDPMPLVALTAFVRHTHGAMPAYQEAILSSEDLTDIHAWLQSLPKPQDYRSIPLLNPSALAVS